MGILPPRSIRASDVDGGVMRGFRSEGQTKDDRMDNGSEPGTVNERNFTKQTGFQKWFNGLLYELT